MAISIVGYIGCRDKEIRRDYEEHIYDNVFSNFLSALPLNPPEPISVDLWTDGTEILCRTEALADMIADGLDKIAGTPESHTGYYDPFEDARSGETDDHTGWYYIDFD